jgi:uncharacterized membrane protein YczE
VNFAVRFAQLIFGLFLYGVADVLIIRAATGLGPWPAFHVGLSLVTPLSVGMAVTLVGAIVIAATWFAGVRPGIGTVANMILIGVFTDLLLPIIPEATDPLVGYPMLAAGAVLIGIATGLYIGAGLGKGPRDGMMVVISERMGWSIRSVRGGIELTVLALGFAMGAPLGIGTVLYALAIGPIVQWSLKLFGLVPAKVEPVAAAAAPVAVVAGVEPAAECRC